MESLIGRAAAQYRLLYVQPDPERGDRVCIGVLFRESAKRFSVLYDQEFAKVQCLAPDVDCDLLRFYLADFRASVERSGDLEVTLKRYGPQLTTSVDRSVAAPVTEKVKQLLFERFALTTTSRLREASRQEQVALPVTIASDRRMTVDHIVAFTGRIAPASQMIKDARPQELLGKKVRRVASVAVGIRGRSSVVLIDGIDLKLSSAKRSITLANKVVHTFWQYGRLKSDDLVEQREVTRVGLVLNGVVPRRQRDAEDYAEAHDYALAQFGQEAELVIDAAKPTDLETLEVLLARA